MSARGVELLAYADRLGGSLAALAELLDGPLADFSGIHLLPFFTPHDGVDAGFDPVDHAAVDPRLGSWDDVRRIAEHREVTADLIVNHISSASAEFADWLARGEDSASDGMFLTFDTVFPEGAHEDEITAFYRPRPGLPFTAYRGAYGRRRLVWTTFMPSQVDLDVAHPSARRYLARMLGVLRDGGVTTVRLDAVGYAVKTPGTDSFMTPATLHFVREIAALARDAGLRVLVEVHAHHAHQSAIAPLVDRVYDFALPPLLLHSLRTATVDRLAEWLRIRPANAVTVLDTHDGIGVVDAGPGAGLPGLLTEEEMAALFAQAAVATGGASAAASVVPEWASSPHQINATFPSVLGGDDDALLLCRAVQLWMPGDPQIYYVGLLGGRDDLELFRESGQGRDVNRHRYSRGELSRALRSTAARAQLALVRLRTRHPAFEGGFSWNVLDDHRLELIRFGGAAEARLTADLASRTFSIELRDEHRSRSLLGIEGLLEEDTR